MKTAIILILLSCVFSCTSKVTESEKLELPYYNTADFTPIWIKDKSSLDSIHSLADFEFSNQNNQQITKEFFRGKIHVMNCFFTVCPSLCPKIMGNMKQIENAFANDKNVLIASYSVTPDRDSVAVLKSYATENQINDRKWHLITGDKKQIYSIIRKSYFADENVGVQKDENDFLHTESFILVDQNLHIRGVYNGTLQLEIDQLIKDIKSLEQ